MAVNGYKFSIAYIEGGGAGSMNDVDGASLLDGDWAVVLDGVNVFNYLLDDDSGDTADNVNIIAPETNPGDKRWLLQKSPQTNTVPIGVIVPWLGGFFTNTANGTYTDVLGETPGSIDPGEGNTVLAVNTLLNPEGWYVCDGAELIDATSPIFNGTGRHLPNLTDDRFIIGLDTGGSIGGSNTTAHTHSMQAHVHSMGHYHNVTHNHPSKTSGGASLSESQGAVHDHRLRFYNFFTSDNQYMAIGYHDTGGSGVYSHQIDNSAGGGYHYHSVNLDSITVRSLYSINGSGVNMSNTGVTSSANTGEPTQAENRPKYLSCFYIMKVN